MPRRWSNKDERKYEAIKQSSIKRGVPTDRAEEIAGRTVNKQRREEDEHPTSVLWAPAIPIVRTKSALAMNSRT